MYLSILAPNGAKHYKDAIYRVSTNCIIPIPPFGAFNPIRLPAEAPKERRQASFALQIRIQTKKPATLCQLIFFI